MTRGGRRWVIMRQRVAGCRIMANGGYCVCRTRLLNWCMSGVVRKCGKCFFPFSYEAGVLYCGMWFVRGLLQRGSV